MNVGTIAAIKGAVATTDLKEIGTQVELSIPIIFIRPGDQIVKQLMACTSELGDRFLRIPAAFGYSLWKGLRKIKEEFGVDFQSHIDGQKILWGRRVCSDSVEPGSTIAMAFDECAPYPATREYMINQLTVQPDGWSDARRRCRS